LERVSNILDDLQSIMYTDYPPFNEFDDYEFNIQLADRLGKVEVGVDNIDDVSTIQERDAILEDSICVVCLENIKENDKVARQLICSHIYCDDCISQWLKKNKKCPICNVDLQDKLESSKA
jgi:hypothetical protein